MTMIDLLQRAADPDATAPEAAACLSAVARIAGTADGLPDPPHGYEWRNGRCVRAEPWCPALPARRPLNPDVEPPTTDAPRPLSRRQKVVAMVLSPEGASLPELMEATGLDATSIRAVVSVARRGRRIDFDRRTGRYLAPQLGQRAVGA